MSTKRVYLFEGWRLDTGRLTLTSPTGENVKLTSGEFAALEMMCRAPQQVLPRHALFPIYKDRPIVTDEASVNVRICRVRKKIEDDPKNPKMVKAIRGIGYFFACPVSIE